MFQCSEGQSTARVVALTTLFFPHCVMVQLKSLVMALAPLAATVAHGASWSFKDGSVSVQGKGVGVDGSFTKEK